ncbi:phage tail protein I [Microbacterium pumilum]|uniref:Phage tail protein n=1 Tax=Microbacterium pumilum TaxID=344165 RepID=A0ABP5EEY9_9MICO
MYGDRGIALIAHEDQWARCAHQHTVLLPGGGIGLDWTPVPSPRQSRWDAESEQCGPSEKKADPPCASGIAHDRWCRTWHTRPLDGMVEATTRKDAPIANCPGALRHPSGVAIDTLDRLYVAESAGHAVMIADLWSGRVIRRVPMRGRPVDLVEHGVDGKPGVLVLTRSPNRIVAVDGRAERCATIRPLRRPCAHPSMKPTRITLLSGRVVVLWRGDGTAIVADDAGKELLEDPAASDIEGTPEGLLVVALAPGDPFRRFSEREDSLIEDEPLAAADYDGGAVTVDPNGRVVYTTSAAPRTTQGPKTRHAREGVVTTYRLDSGVYRTRWGRVFVDACLPTGTGLTIRVLTTDEDEVVDPLPPSTPARGIPRVRSPEETPPLPSSSAMKDTNPLPVVPRGAVGALAAVDPIVTGTEWATYETGVAAPPGRYLWLQLVLTGTERTSPRVRAVRVERPGHALLSTLPRLFSSVDEQADFLHRYLMAAEGMLHDLDTAAAERRILVDPFTTPDEFLPWLASFAGIVLDDRWSEDARRELLAEVYQLFARRGTIGMLERMLRLYLGRDARIVERWRLRGLGGGILGFDPTDRLYSPTVAGTTVKAGMLGHFTIGGEHPDTSSYKRLAHRFTVLVPGCLSTEQRDVVDDLIRVHKPSHTLGDVCELGDGMPVGRLRLGLTAFVAPPPGRSVSVMGRARLGQGSTVGAPTLGSRVSGTRLGGVRVG